MSPRLEQFAQHTQKVRVVYSVSRSKTGLDVRTSHFSNQDAKFKCFLWLHLSSIRRKSFALCSFYSCVQISIPLNSFSLYKNHLSTGYISSLNLDILPMCGKPGTFRIYFGLSLSHSLNISTNSELITHPDSLIWNHQWSFGLCFRHLLGRGGKSRGQHPAPFHSSHIQTHHSPLLLGEIPAQTGPFI